VCVFLLVPEVLSGGHRQLREGRHSAVTRCDS
jgi:hypothetical protein